MRRTRLLPLLVAALVLSLALMGCGLVSPAIRLLSGPTATPPARVIEKVVVVTPTAQPLAATPAPSVNIAPGADVESQILEAIYQKVNPSVVYIENLVKPTRSTITQAVPESSGSGFVWDAQGHIITNNHVVSGADELRVTFADGVELPATVVATDPDSDLAVIIVDPKFARLVPVERGDIAEVVVGQRAVAIGNPFGKLQMGTMTVGIVSAIGRSIPSVTQFQIPEAIQTDAAINPGNSGGPLLNDRGQVIGVNAQIRSESGSNSGVGFAIPISIVQRVVPALIKDGKYRHAYLGISGNTYSPAWADALGFSTDVRGAYLMAMVSGGPSDKAGLRGASKDTKVVLDIGVSGPIYLPSGGDLVTAIDGQAVAKFDDLLIYLERNKSPGDEVKLTIVRAGEGQKTITVKLSERPARVQ
ncbi:MAG: trypsin-like peptidase domain-containing protein [Chloroflexi bacterium]|nr:trypsin-like peptidase domain-containing protein [Chloroflexota bacterium]